jgi:lipopolysaccharide/colanic/teichoic acid biosynthesis glycosyltransferase
MYKFRTMVVGADRMGPSSTTADDPRVTSIGRVIRRLNVDELPQFVNVLRGDMSVVGPRPQVPWAVERYTPEERAILSVRPGITDWASLWVGDEGERLRGSTNPDRDYLEKIWPEKRRLQLEYIQSQSLAVDTVIVLRTLKSHLIGRLVPRVLRGHTT